VRIVQITPEIGPGTGVGAVAHHLEREWSHQGHAVDRFTLDDCGGRWLAARSPGVRGKLRHAARVTWFSTVGTVCARRMLRRLPPEAVSICHNDVVAGDVYVNHGILQVSLRARGHYVARLVRNPVHLLTVARDHVRFRSGVHRAVVNLVTREVEDLHRTYRTVTPRSVVIGNGVDVERYRPPSPDRRAALRSSLGVGADDVLLVFIGHEFHRKGLPATLASLTHLSSRHHLVVVGGAPEMVDDVRTESVRRGVGARVHLLGSRPDPRPALHAGDLLVTASLYESYGLVVLEAMACGLPVIGTPVGCVPDVVVDGVNGWVTDGSAEDIARCVREAGASDAGAVSAAARATAEEHSWAEVAERYVRLFDEVVAERVAVRRR
jgi:glycosyltransferase involved in cell wall biosynthesis